MPDLAQERKYLALALDIDDVVGALRMARRLSPYFSVAKVGLELFSAGGPEVVAALSAEGYKVFVDLKLHDIPTTVRKAARVIGGLGTAFTTVHTQGGLAMLQAAVEGMEEGASSVGAPSPCVLGVTVLTSDARASQSVLLERAGIAREARCGGIVCAAGDLRVISRMTEGMVKVVPGIRPTGTSVDDQARASTPGAAIGAGADVLVIGRAVTAAADPERVASEVLAEVAASVTARAV